MASTWTSKLSDTYAALWKMVIRPPRAKYLLADLGPQRFYVIDREFLRKDLELKNSRGMTLKCSHFVPVDIPLGDRYPCVVYVHGNCSSRLEVLPSLRRLLQRDLTVFCMDLSGSGWSEGEFISLGYHEQQDLRVVLDHLRTCSFVSSIGLWGRSMGAVTAILRASEDPSIAACVLDSPFSSLRKVAEELVASKRINLPSFLTGFALQFVRSEVQSRAGFDIDSLCPIEVVPRASVPVLFVTASDDTFVLPHHTEELCSAWGSSERTIMQVGGSHNSTRPHWFLDSAAAFLQNRLFIAHAIFVSDPKKAASMAVRRLPLETIPVPRSVPIAMMEAEDELLSSEKPTAPIMDSQIRRSSSGRKMQLLKQNTEGSESTRATETPAREHSQGTGESTTSSKEPFDPPSRRCEIAGVAVL